MFENTIKKKISGILNQPKEIQLRNGWNVLTPEGSKQFLESQEFISQSRFIIDYAHNVLKSIDELLSFYDSEIEIDFNGNVPFCFSEYNRYFSNVLNSFYQFIEYCQKHIKWPNNIIQDCYDNNFSYRLISEIRKQDTHVFFSISAVEKKITNEKTDIKYLVDLDDLLDNKLVKSNFRQEIEKMNDKRVCINDLCAEFKQVFIKLICNIFTANELKITESFEKLVNVCKKDDGSFYNETIIFRDKIPLSLNKTTKNFLLEFAGFMNYLGFYHLSKIKDKKLEMLFRRINYLNFGDEISFPKIKCLF